MTSTLVPASLGFPHLFKQAQLAGASLNVQILCHFCRGNATDSLANSITRVPLSCYMFVVYMHPCMHDYGISRCVQPKGCLPTSSQLVPSICCRAVQQRWCWKARRRGLTSFPTGISHLTSPKYPQKQPRIRVRVNPNAQTLQHRYRELMMAIRDSTSFQSRASLQTKFECLSDAPHPARLKRPKASF